MPWALAIREVESRKVILITEGMRIDEEDPRYEDEVHIVPCDEDPKDKEVLSFGYHDFTKECCCQPRTETRVGRSLIVHKDKVN